MPKFGAIKRQDLIRYLKQLGFSEPTRGGKHQQMKKGTITLTIPNPHQGDIGKELLSRILKQVSITREEWENL